MNHRQARAFSRRFSVMAMQPGDIINGPTGTEVYRHPRLVGWGQDAIAYMFDGWAIGVLIIRADSSGEIRYCDREGRPHVEDIERGHPRQLMTAGMVRMAEVVKAFLGEHHPLADAASANTVPA